jgi:citrate lyase subunit beta / citryl-CoA lyase
MVRCCLTVRVFENVDPRDALDSGADALLLELGDVMGAARRDRRTSARELLRRMRETLPGLALYVRVAPVESGEIDADLAALIPAAPDGVFLEQACGAASLQHLAAKLCLCEAQAGVTKGVTRIVAMAAQTPAAVFQLGAYGGATRLAGLAFEAGALPQSTQVMARGLLVLGAAAAGTLAIDASPAEDDAEFATQCAAARREGFAAKLAFSPAQAAVVRAVFAR